MIENISKRLNEKPEILSHFQDRPLRGPNTRRNRATSIRQKKFLMDQNAKTPI